MSNSNNPLRDKLLAQGEPARKTERYVRHEQETQVMIEKLERRLRMEKWGVTALWIYAVLLMTAMLLGVGFWGHAPEVSMLAGAFVILLYGGIELVKHFINRSRVEVLKELKGLELHLLALEERLRDGGR
jgi:hypothetical protein